jgi:tRNA modification GTPase
MARVTIVQKQLDQQTLAGRPFRVVLTGPPNVGKSSLFNALLGKAVALVSPRPGTTRDYLVARVEWHGVALELVDTAGIREAEDFIGQRAQTLGKDQFEQADLILNCTEAGAPGQGVSIAGDASRQMLVITKADLLPHDNLPGAASASAAVTSATTGVGLDELRTVLSERGRARRASPLAPSLSRCRQHVRACLEHLRQAHAIALYEEPPELLALELRGALDQLGEMVGAVYTDDLLDRIFSRFCIGK